MKKILIFSMFFIIVGSLHAQFESFINFELPDSLVAIDTTLPGNIWQIGTPQKVFFDSAFSVPNAIVTDRVHSYPPSNYSTFTLRITPTNYLTTIVVVQYLHKFDTDSLHDGGYIEDSYDGGTTWTNIVNDPFIIFYYNPEEMTNPVIANGNAAYTGRSKSNNGMANGWRLDGLGWCYFTFTNPIYLRFVFSSDTIQSIREGWMLDNFYIYASICEGISEQVDIPLISLSPNPATDKLMVSRNNNNSVGDIVIYDEFGRSWFREDQFNSESIDVSGFPTGIYILRYTDTNSCTSKKFIVTR